MRKSQPTILGILLCLAISANAQVGVRGQMYLPNGAPLHRSIRFTLRTDDGGRNEILFTDSNGRIEIVQSVTVPYTITVEGDDETYDTTIKAFDPAYSRNYITINLKPFTPKKTSPPGLVSLSSTDQNVSPPAKEAYEAALKMIRAQQFEQALEPLNRAVALAPDYFHAYNDLGVVYMKLKKLDQAANALRRAVKINDKVYLPQLNLGIVLNQLGQYKESVVILTKLERDHSDLLQRINPPLTEALIGSQQWAQAEEELKKGLTLKDADMVDSKIKLGMVLLKQGKSGPAVAVLQEATKAEPDNALGQFNLGAALLQNKELNGAEVALRRAYEIKGSGMPGAQLLLGDLYFQKKDYPKAIEAFRAYLRDLPNAPNADQVKEAIERLRKALNHKP